MAKTKTMLKTSLSLVFWAFRLASSLAMCSFKATFGPDSRFGHSFYSKQPFQSAKKVNSRHERPEFIVWGGSEVNTVRFTGIH
jgi:hypothetical protein